MKYIATLIILSFLFCFVSCESCKVTSDRTEEKAALKNIDDVGISENKDLVVAYYDNKPITWGELENEVKTNLFNFQEKIYQMKLTSLEEIIQKRILEDEAKKSGLSAKELMKKEIEDKIEIDSKELGEFYSRFQDRLEGTVEDKKKQLEDILKKRKASELSTSYVADLKKKHKVEILLEPPEPPVMAVTKGDSAETGPVDAKVTIIEFSDYQCPFCKRGDETLKSLKDKYKEKINIVFRNYPISYHPEAQIAAQAAECARDQNKYWELHDKLFTNNNNLKKEDLFKYAQEFNFDMTSFTTCFDSQKVKDKIAADLKEAENLGVKGVPAIFVNGRLVPGSKPQDYFENLIEKLIKK